MYESQAAHMTHIGKRGSLVHLVTQLNTWVSLTCVYLPLASSVYLSVYLPLDSNNLFSLSRPIITCGPFN